MRLWLPLLIALIILSSVLIYRHYFGQSGSPPAITQASNRVIHLGKPFETDFYDQAYQLAKDYKKESPKKQVVGGIIPHHLLVSPIIAAFFEGLPKQKIKTVILIGPNHYNLDDPRVSVSEGVWKTVYGDLNPDNQIIDKLKASQIITANEKVFDTEHSIFGLTTFIKKTFPDADIVPIIFKSYVKKDECDQIADLLNQIMDDETLLIASVDFSHYLTSGEADKFDQQSLEAIESFDLDRVFKLDGTKNFDSPASIYTLLKVMKLRGATNPVLLQHTNSAKYSNQPNLTKTTSYFTIYFTKPGNLSFQP